MMNKKKRFCFVLISLFVSYGLIEIIFSLWYLSREKNSCFLQENEKGPFYFDSVHGYLRNREPARQMLITRGIVEFDGIIRGNNLGFADHDDFVWSFQNRKIAVFGDSFTSGEHTPTNWPDLVEHEIGDYFPNLQLVNFAAAAGGIVNWWSTWTRYANRLPIDWAGIIFAVYTNDLYRPFAMMHSVPKEKIYLKHHQSWRPETLPQTLADANLAMTPFSASSLEMDEIFQKKKCPVRFQKQVPLFTPIIWTKFRHAFLQQEDRYVPSSDILNTEKRLAGERGQYISYYVNEIKQSLRQRKVPVMVVYLPSKQEAMTGEYGGRAEIQGFANELGAFFVDGSGIFSALSPKERSQFYFRYDGHWNEKGTRRFAQLMNQEIQKYFLSKTNS